MFLDEKGEKISKSKGNGITIEEWLKYASPESLSLYMYQNPKRAKKLYADVVPKAVDEYLAHALINLANKTANRNFLIQFGMFIMEILQKRNQLCRFQFY